MSALENAASGHKAHNPCTLESIQLLSRFLGIILQVRGSHVGTYLPSSGIWNHTQRFLKKGASNEKTVRHLDFDAPTREHAQQLPDDKVFFDNYHLFDKSVTYVQFGVMCIQLLPCWNKRIAEIFNTFEHDNYKMQ